MQTFPLIESQLRLQYRLLNHSGFWTQLHAQDVMNERLVSRELVNGEEEVVKWARSFNAKANLFLGRNPRIKDGTVAGITCVSFDIDPVREPKRAALPEQHSRAIQAARTLQDSLGGSTYLSSSGNGALIVCPFESVEPDIECITQRLRVFEESLRKQISDPWVRLDATYDANRLVKAMGSVSVKGDPKLWRYARFIDRPVFFRAKRSRIREVLTANSGHRAVTVPRSLPDYDHTKFTDRGRAEFALAVRCQLAGLTAGDTLQVLREHGYMPTREDDHRRLIDKIYSTPRATQSGPGALLPGLSGIRGEVNRPAIPGSSGLTEPLQQPLQLWIPGQGFQEYEQELTRRREGNAERITTGFEGIDSRIYELPRKEISTLASRSGYGKTSFIVTVSEHLRSRGKRILFFSTEFNRLGIFDKFLSVGASIPTFELTSGQLAARSHELIRVYRDSLSHAPVYICDYSSPSLRQIREQVEAIKPDLFVFDHINWVANDRVSIREYFKGLKQIAVDYGIAGVVMAQLNEPPRDLQNGGFMDSDRSDIRESKDLITDSAVLVVWQNHGAPDGPIQRVKVTISKGRYGGMNESCFLQVDKRYGRFEVAND